MKIQIVKTQNCENINYNKNVKIPTCAKDQSKFDISGEKIKITKNLTKIKGCGQIHTFFMK